MGGWSFGRRRWEADRIGIEGGMVVVREGRRVKGKGGKVGFDVRCRRSSSLLNSALLEFWVDPRSRLPASPTLQLQPPP